MGRDAGHRAVGRVAVAAGVGPARCSPGEPVAAAAGVHRHLFTLCTVAAFLVDPADLAEVFIAPDLLTIVYFACFMLTDPPTSPGRGRPQLLAGALVALVSVVVFLRMAAADYLLAGVLAGNVFEALRRRLQGRAVAVRLVPRSRHHAREAAGTINFPIQ